MSVTNALNPNVVKTDLDGVFFQEYEYQANPGTATAETQAVFKQRNITNAAYQEEISGGGGGFWSVKGETQDVDQANPRIANKATYTAATLAKSIPISKEYFDDNMHGAWEGTVKKFASNARATRDKNAFGAYRDSFTTQLTADGVAFISASHVTITGITVSNRLTLNPVFSDDSLNTAMVQLMELKAQDGVVGGSVANCLLVPPTLFKKACQVVDSELQADTANNNFNLYSSKYSIMVYQSPYLGTAGGGSDTAWWLLGRNHSMTRYIRQGIQTDIIDYKFSTNNNYVYKGMFRETVGVSDYLGAVGSDGTGA